MSFSKLPFDILGQVGPVLSWVESDDGGPLPDTWTSKAQPFQKRENGWLLDQLPTYSVDNVREIVIGTRFRHRRQKIRPAKLPFREERQRPALDPPYDYDLLQAFSRLNQHFLIWNGTEPCIRAGLMEELHELAQRLPSSHIVRHGHARAVAEGVLSIDEALDLPENITLLPSNSFGLRSVVRRGLSEGHLHLTAVTSAEETWADSLLQPLSHTSISGSNPQEHRLLVLNLFAGRILALAVWMSVLDSKADELDDPEKATRARPNRLLRLLDQLYFARTPYTARWAALRLDKGIRDALYGREPDETSDISNLRKELRERLEELDETTRELESIGLGKNLEARIRRQEQQIHTLQQEWDQAETRRQLDITVIARRVPPEYRFLLRWISPTAWRIREIGRSSAVGLPGSLPEDLEYRHRLVHRLHLAAHLRLIQLSTRKKAGESDHRAPEDKRPDRRRHFLHRSLFRYLVCRTHHWQTATQQGQTTGLRHFKQYFDSPQRKKLRGTTELQRAELTFDRLRQWRGLRVLEGRVSPPRRSHDLVPWILAHARPEDRRIEKFGLVVHFIKEPEDEEDPSFSSGIPSPAPRLRWGRRRRRVREEGVRLYRLLRRPTPVTPFVVGIDAANLELATPPEVFAPVFRFLREFPIDLGGDPRQFSPYLGLDASIRALLGKRRLGMTFHVGEDFRHLLSGLRAICEVVEFLAPNPGDRLGHGTALALSPKHWLEQNGYQAVVPKLEWLDTLVWVHHFLGPGDDLVGALAIEDQIQRYSSEIYREAVARHYDPLDLDQGSVWRGPDRRRATKPRRRGLLDWDWSPLTLWDAWRLRQLDPYSIDLPQLLRGKLELRPPRIYTEEERRWQQVQERVMREIRRDVGSRNAYVLLALYWLDPKVRKHGDEIIIVHMKEQRHLWLELCRRVEDRMKTLIHHKELVVEVNPSSNRIIGPMASYDQHHVFHLTLGDDQRLSRSVRVSVNTDNPAVCNTTLAHEHYLIGEVLIRRGVPEAEVVEWLEWLRQNGETYNFARRLKSPEESADMRRLLDWLRGIRKSVREARTRQEKRQAFWSWLRESRLRAHGFDRDRIAKEPEVLERLVSLERRLKETMAQSKLTERLEVLGRWLGDPGGKDLEQRLAELERLVASLSQPDET